MARIFLALGSNMGDRLKELEAAVEALRGWVVVERSSAVYESAAAYMEEQPPFLNAVIVGETTLEPLALLQRLKQIEMERGRRPGRRFGPRPLDLDLLLYDDVVLETPDLIVPHPRMTERAFVLRPLADLAPALIIPNTHESVEALAEKATVGEVLAQVAEGIF